MKNFYLKPMLFSSFKGYKAGQFAKDMVAGLIVAIIALPLSIALAIASDVPAECGIYTAIAAGLMVSLFGGSRVQIAGPTAAFAVIVAGIKNENGMDGLFIATLMAGVILIVMGVLKLGALIKYIPTTITVGFTAGIAVTIFVGQIKDFLGLKYAEGTPAPIETFEKIHANIEAIGTFNWQALVVGAVCLLILIVYPKIEKRVPPSLIAVIVGALMVKLIPGFDGVATISDIPAGLPSVNFGEMDLSLDKIISVVPDAFTIALLAGIESLLSCVVADGMIGTRHNSNAELVGQGMANIASSLFGGIPATGAIARTAANIKNGGRTPVAGIVHALVLLLVLLVLMPYASLIPMPAIAAILFVVAYNMSEWKKFVSIVKKAPKSDILVMVLTFVLTVVFDLVVAIAVGMVLVAVLFIKRMSKESAVTSWAETEGAVADKKQVPDGVAVYDVRGVLFFGSADKISAIEPAEGVRCVILRMSGVTALDITAMNAINALYKRCAGQGVRLILSHVNAQPMKVMKKSGFYDAVGSESFCENIDKALALAE